MRKITCVNNNGLSVVFMYDHDETEFFLVSTEGLYKVKNNVNTTQNATTDGSTYAGDALEERNITILVNIRRNHQQNRDMLERVLKLHSEGTLYHEENGRTRRIEYYVEDIEIPDKGVIRTATIQLKCPDPYFKDEEATHIEMASWESGWEFPLEITEEGMEFGTRSKETIKVVDNNSTTAIGIQMTIVAEDTVINPTIMNVTTGETLKLLCEMNPDDEIIITTQQGNIDVVLIRDGKQSDYNWTVDEDNEGYIQLETGRNYINYTADDGGDYMNVNFDFENRYVMP